MKWILFILFSCCGLNSESQENTDSVYSKSYYLNKSIQQKKTARILLIGGTTIGVIGAATFDPFGNGADASGIMLVLGVIADITSVVFFSNASKNKKLSASVNFRYQPILSNNPRFYTSIRQPSVVFKIKF